MKYLPQSRGVSQGIVVAVLLGVLAVLNPEVVWGWGGRQHLDINYAAAKNVPDEMAAWREYAKELAPLGIQPDLWKEGDPAEGPRHYIEPENLKGVVFTNLPRDQAAGYAACGITNAAQAGEAPWVIAALRQRLTAAMAASNWTEAVQVAGALGHYVGDTHQPLHCTKDFDGDWVSNRGIHLRWEKNMPENRWHHSMIRADPARYIEDSWAYSLDWMQKAHRRAKEVFKHDRTARHKTDNDVESTAYYELMWSESKDLFIEQMSDSVTDLSCLWYSAWVDAGKPAIPLPPVKVSPDSIFGPALEALPEPAPAPVAPPAVPVGLVVGLFLLLLAVILIGARWRRPRKPDASDSTLP